MSTLLLALAFLAAEPTPELPELKALAGYVGRWDCRFEDNLHGASLKGTAEGEWILGGRFLHQTWTIDEPVLSGSSIMTYDPGKKSYRSWHFVSNGSTSEGAGKYDEKTKIMTWTVRDANGLRTTTHSSFDKDGNESWTITVADGDGKVVSDMKGRNTKRRK